MKKDLAIFDFDNTIIKGYSHFLFFKFCIRKKIIPQHYYYLGLIFFLLYKMKLLTSIKILLKSLYMKFSGWKIEQMQDLCHEFYNKELKERLRPEILQEIDNHKKRQSKIIVVSAAICPLISIVSNNLDFDDYLCTSLKKNGLVLTGEIGDIPYSKDKVKYLNGAIDLKNYNDVWVYSDHYSDIPMMKMATMPIAVNPDSKLRKFARINKWRVI